MPENFFEKENAEGQQNIPITPSSPESPSNSVSQGWNKAGSFKIKGKGQLKNFEFPKPQGYEYSDDDYYDEEEPETPASRGADDSGLSVEAKTVLSQIVEGSEPDSDGKDQNRIKPTISALTIENIDKSEGSRDDPTRTANYSSAIQKDRESELKDTQEKDERDAKIKDLEKRLKEAEVARDNQLIADLERKLANALKDAEVAKEN